jgi:hypothetical protein
MMKLYRPAPGEPDAYPRLGPSMTRPIRWDVIGHHRGLTPLFWAHVAPYGEERLNMSRRLSLRSG